jgi:hypothetical protein
MTRQRRISNGVWVVAVACALVAPPVAVGLYVVATVLMLALPFVHLRRPAARVGSSVDP